MVEGGTKAVYREASHYLGMAGTGMIRGKHANWTSVQSAELSNSLVEFWDYLLQVKP